MADVTMSDRDVQDLGAYRYLGSTPGELAKKIADLEKDNQKERGKVADLTEKAKAAPPEGAVVLTGEDATAYAAWKALEIKPEDVAKLKADNATLAAEKARRDRQDILAAASPTEGWNENAPKALLKLAGFDAVELSAGEVTVERMNAGKKENVKAPTAFVTVDGKQVRISEWLAKEAPEWVPMLSAQTTGNGGSSDGSPGIPMAEMRGGSSGAPAKASDSLEAAKARMAERAKAPNAITQRVPAPTT